MRRDLVRWKSLFSSPDARKDELLVRFLGSVCGGVGSGFLMWLSVSQAKGAHYLAPPRGAAMGTGMCNTGDYLKIPVLR